MPGLQAPLGSKRVLGLATMIAGLLLPATGFAQADSIPQQDSVRLVDSIPVPQQATPPVVDTIIVNRSNVFPPDVAEGSGIFRIMNAIHIVTKEYVIRNELLFEVGQPLDSTLIAETERNLRKKNIFREVTFDTIRVDGRLAVEVDTHDGWSLKPKFSLGAASDGTITGQIGINDINLFGTGNQAYVAWEKQVDRQGINASVKFSRILATNLDLSGNYAGLSDGKNGNWYLGFPLRSVQSNSGLEHNGLAANQNVIQYRVDDAGEDSTVFRRQALILDLDATVALQTSGRGYLRAGLHGEFRNEGYSGNDSLGIGIPTIPDSLYGVFGGFVEANRVRFWEVNRLNGFGTEDVDLSLSLRLGVDVALSGLGFEKSGLGPSIRAAAGIPLPNGFVWAALDANALWNSAGLDSGRVLISVSSGFKPADKHALVGQIQAGLLENTPPGSEFDLGYQNAPRSWAPHAFVGTRTIWSMFEYRWFAFQHVLNLADVALAAFADYGGAWYEDQDRRFGGNIGFGLRSGSALATVATTGRLDFGWRFGNDLGEGSEFVVSFGSGFVFPRRTAPAISYKASPP
jgi:hypothetical protein